MARLTKYDIARMIEKLPGNTPWGLYSMMTVFYDSYTRSELVSIYNQIIADRRLDLQAIS